MTLNLRNSILGSIGFILQPPSSFAVVSLLQDRVSLCHNCITDGAWCWATTWPTCVKQCLEWQLSSAAQFSLCSRFQCFHARWDPIECTQCWLTNYTSTCLGDLAAFSGIVCQHFTPAILCFVLFFSSFPVVRSFITWP